MSFCTKSHSHSQCSAQKKNKFSMMNVCDQLPCCKSNSRGQYRIHANIVVSENITERGGRYQCSKFPDLMTIQFFSQTKYGISTEYSKKKRRKPVRKSSNAKKMIAQRRGPEKKMRFINIITAMIIQRNVIAGKIHSQSNIGVMSRIIIHQGNKKPGDINQSQQREKKNICAVRKDRGVQSKNLYKVNKPKPDL